MSGDRAQARRGLARETMLYGLGVVLTRVISFLMLPIYTRYLTPADYGVLQLLQMTLDVTAILLSAGLTSGVLRFYLKADREDERLAVVASAFFLLLALNAIGTGALSLGAPWIAAAVLSGAGPEGPLLVRIVSVTFLLECWVAVPLLLLQARRQAGWYTAATLARISVQLGLNILLVVVLGFGVKGVLLGTLAANLLVGGALVVWMLRETGLRLRRSAVRDLRRFGVPYQIAMAGSFVLSFGDRAFLEHWQGLAAVGLYGLAYQFGLLLHGLGAGPFFRAWSPQRLGLADSPPAARDASYNESLLALSLLVITLGVGLALFVRPALHVLSAPAFHPAAALVPLLLLSFVLQIWTDAVNLGIEVSEKTRYAGIAVWASVAAVLGLYLALVPGFGAMGAALARVVGMGLRLVLTYRFSQRLWPVGWRLAPNLRVLGWGAAAVVASELLAPEGTWLQIAVGSALFAAFAAAVWFDVVPRGLRARILTWLRSPAAALSSLGSG